MKLILERWKKYTKEQELLTKWSQITGIPVSELKEAISRRSFLRGGAAVALSSILGCDVEYGITADKTNIGSPGDTGDTGGGTNIPFDELPNCTQQVEWSPPPSDPRWEEGVPIEDFVVHGRNLDLPAEQWEGDLLGSTIIDPIEDGGSTFLYAWWGNVPDVCDFWTSDFNPWADVGGPRDISTMDVVYEAYSKAPLLRVSVAFLVEYRNGRKYLKLLRGADGTSSISLENMDSECVKSYLEVIGKSVEDYGAE